MSRSILFIWNLIKSGRLLMEQKGNGLETPILKEEIEEYGVINHVRPATSHDIKFIFESDAWKSMVLSGAVFDY